jgi:hypothetical protein
MREAIETMVSGVVTLVFGILWLQLFAAFWVPGGFSFLEAEIRWIISVGSCAACVLLPLGGLLVMAGLVWGFSRLVHTRCRAYAMDPPIPPARVARGLRRHRTKNVLACVRSLGEARNL